MMINKQGRSLAVAGAFALAAFAVHGEAYGQENQEATNPERNTTTLDVGAGFGYSSNPRLAEDAEGSAFGRVSAYLQHVRRSARTTTRVTAYAENDTYFRDHGSKQRFSLSAGTSHAATEKLRVFGNLGASVDFGGQLLGRIYGVPVDGIGSIVPDPEFNPLPPPDFLDPDLVWSDRRVYRVNGQVGVSTSISPRDSVALAAGADRSWIDGGGASDSTTFYQSVSWNRTLSERSAVGAQVGFREADYEGPDNGVFVISPGLTYRTTFSENWSASLSGGASIVKRQSIGGSDTSVSPTFSGSLCHTQGESSFCVGAGRSIQTTSGLGALNSWNVNASYYRRLDVNNTIQLQANYRRYRSPAFGSVDAFHSNYYGASAGLSHRLSDRFSVDAQAGYRTADRPDRKVKGDVSGTVSLRYRLGDL